MIKTIFVDFLITAAVLVALTCIGLHYNERELYQRDISMINSDIEYLSSELKRRNADDCIIETTTYGWKCTDRKGRVYKVRENSGLRDDAPLPISFQELGGDNT